MTKQTDPRKMALLLLLFWPLALAAQTGVPAGPQRLTIREAYRLAREHYPSSRQRGLIGQTKEFTLENAAKSYLPQLSFSGQATLQSDVTNLPIKLPVAGFTMPAYSKDQYKIYGEVDQVIYDGGLIHNQQEAARTAALINEKNLDVELYALFDRVDQLFFGVLILDEQLAQNDLLQQDINNGIAKMQAMLDNGIAYKSSLDELRAQLLQAQQSKTDEQLTRKAYFDMLLLLTGLPPNTLDPRVPLAEPPDLNLPTAISRPELLLFEYQKHNYDLQDQMAGAQLRPRLNLFLQGGYARPGLNMLSNNFAWYYLGGARLTWNLGGLYTLHRQHQLSDIGRRSLDIQQETFLLNTQLEQQQAFAGLEKYAALMRDDEKIVRLRTAVKNTALSQLTEGVLSAHDYVSQAIAEDQARRNYILHHMQWLQSEYNYQTIVGH